MPECSYCRKTFPGVGLDAGHHNWLTCANERIAELEAALRKWRDAYEYSNDGTWVMIPVHQLIALIGKKTTER